MRTCFLLHTVPLALPRVSCLMLSVLLLASVGCSSFERQWSALAEQPAPVARPDGGGITGRWEGKWHSEESDHEGKLRCIVIRTEPAGDDAAKPTGAAPASASNYLFSFSAVWGPGFVSEYEIAMTVQRESPGRTTFEGEMNLGVLVGTYRCKGHIEGATFFATYTAEKDHGTFEMTRPK